ncbi:sam 7 link chp: probable dna metabolism protein [Lucifera butyrica]|uniref:Sam 7 link chp: probable dna metabolism protein n=1 Tax=Lucifera butyrica TaxID=1351585 RepID=A0A498R3Z6_9FIRM|nr:TIGR03915 family putative DNA repair protein [Lucifera butyrica]VBB05879.1 sam 7 link chp: probable dna metabolism protein [Lucifera butyrica]
MPIRSDLIYHYDGSFDGLLCCVFESYEKRELPLDILLTGGSQSGLFSGKEIPTELPKAGRVLASIPKKMGTAALDFVRHAFLTCLPQKELTILQFLRLGYRYGPSVINMLTNETVNTLFKAVKHLERESHLLKGFLRFSIFNNVLVGEIAPKNYVLPLLVQHFCERYPEERFLIHDKNHGMGLVYQPYQSAVIPITALELPAADAEEQRFRELWQLFYDTIAIKERYNPTCRMSHMPKRYWESMTEFSRTSNTPPKLPGSGEKLLPETKSKYLLEKLPAAPE